MSDKTIKSRQNGHEVRGFIESQGIIIAWDGNRVTCDIDDLIGVVLTLCAYERSLERDAWRGEEEVEYVGGAVNLDIDSYRNVTIGTARELRTEERPAVRASMSETVIHNVGALCDEVERLRATQADAEQRALQWQATAEALNLRNHEAWVMVGQFSWAAETALKALAENARAAKWAREPYAMLKRLVDEVKPKK